MPAVTAAKAQLGRSPQADEDAESEGQKGAITSAKRNPVELLAKKWPGEYPAGAAKWFILDEVRVSCVATPGGLFWRPKMTTATRGLRNQSQTAGCNRVKENQTRLKA